MKTIFSKRLMTILAGAAVLVLNSCSKLDEDLKDPLYENPQTAGGAPSPGSLSSVYGQLNQLVGNDNWFALSEHTTDELLGPTRGTDWDDFGTYRKLHLHTWDGAHNQINTVWNGINGALFQSTLLAETATGQVQAEAKFLRAYFTYIATDFFGQVQHRAATATVDVLPDVYTRSEAIDFVISELESIIGALPAFDHNNRNAATKEAAKFLLAKSYLNRAVYKADPTTPEGPYTFDPGDMNKVIQLVDEISANPTLTLAGVLPNTSYWDNFVWDNGTKSSENIFVRKNSDGINVTWASAMGNHYSMPPDGWNGFTTLSNFYNAFEADDVRRQQNIAGFTELTGRPAGFLIGQQRGPVDKKIGSPIVDLKDRSGNPLIFTPDVSLFFSTEAKGIRTNKYPLDPAEMNGGGNASKNEFVFFRLSDALLMKAEAILRGGTSATTPLSIVNTIRAARSASDLASVDLPTLLSERGRELYLEAVRRNDLIRFGKFNDPVQERSSKSSGFRVVFPITNVALSSNPNLHQNFGY